MLGWTRSRTRCSCGGRRCSKHEWLEQTSRRSRRFERLHPLSLRSEIFLATKHDGGARAAGRHQHGNARKCLSVREGHSRLARLAAGESEGVLLGLDLSSTGYEKRARANAHNYAAQHAEDETSRRRRAKGKCENHRSDVKVQMKMFAK